jgi:hypothetical protein
MSELPDGGAALATDRVPGVRGGTNVKLGPPTADQITIPADAATGQIPYTVAAALMGLGVTFEESFGAIGDGNPHPLSERFGSDFAAAQAVYPFATALTDQIDYCALKLGIQSGVRHLVGRGQYYVNNDDLAHMIRFSDRQTITFLRGSAVKYTKFCYPVFVGLDLTSLLVDGLNLVALETAFDQEVRVTRAALAAVLGSTFKQIGAANNFNNTIGLYGCDNCWFINGKHAAAVPGQFSSTPTLFYLHPKSDEAFNICYNNKIINWEMNDYVFAILYNAQWFMETRNITSVRYDQYRGDSGYWPNGHLIYPSSATDILNVGNLIENISDRGDFIGSDGMPYTVNTGTDVFTVVAHGMANGDFVKFVGVPPLPLVKNKVYKIANVTTDTFKLNHYNAAVTIDITGTVGADSKICKRNALHVMNTRWLSRSTVRGIHSTRDQGLFSIHDVDDVTVEDFLIDNEVITLTPTAGSVSDFTVPAINIPPQGAWCGREMRVISGPGVGEVRLIRSVSTAGVVKWVGADLATAITTGSSVEIGTWGFCSQAPITMPGTSVNRGLTLQSGKVRAIPSLINALSVNAGTPHKELLIRNVLLDVDVSVGLTGIAIIQAVKSRIELDLMVRGAWPSSDLPTITWISGAEDCQAIINMLPGSLQTMVESSAVGVARCFTSWRGPGAWAHRDGAKILLDTLTTAGTGLRKTMDGGIEQTFKATSLTAGLTPTFAFEVPRDEAGTFIKGLYQVLFSARAGTNWRIGEWRVKYIGTTSTQRFATEISDENLSAGTDITDMALAINSSSVITLTITQGVSQAIVLAGAIRLLSAA